MTTQTQATERVAPVEGGLAVVGFVRSYVGAILVTLLVLAGALLGPSALANAAREGGPIRARLDVDWAYVLLAPLTNVLDTLSVLTLGQHYAVLATLILAFGLWRLLRRRRPLGPARRLAMEAVVAVVAFLGLVALYAFGTLAPRPMATLVPTDDDIVVVDVHSHTAHSHDGRPGFDAESNRDWHEGAGFDAVYVSDHRTYQGYEEGIAGNPSRAGDGVVLLPGLEIKFADKYSSALGEAWRYRSAMRGNHLIPDSLYRVMDETGIAPTLVLTIPSELSGVVAAAGDSIGFVAVELSDASPRGLQQSRRDRARILSLADSLDLALVAASNNHGWGRTAAAWTLMRIEGWRELTPAQLNAAIEGKLHSERRGASWVVERRVAWSGPSPVALAVTAPAVAWSMFGGIGPGERVSWILWSWLLALGVRRSRHSLS